jgi:hypothetical protein
MTQRAVLSLILVCGAGALAPAYAQRLPFERGLDVAAAPVLDVSTIRGRIDVSVGEPGRIVVTGAVTVRVAWDVPADAPARARRIADQPPLEQQGSTVRLRPPADAVDRRAVTVSYAVRVPPGTDVTAVSGSGATIVRGVSGPVTIRTQSGAIEVARLGGAAEITTGSGSVRVDGVAGSLSVTTQSSAFEGRSLRGNVRVRTRSGAIDGTSTGDGDVDVEAGSSSIRWNGARGALTASTQSGRVTIQGAPARAWEISTGSGSVALSLEPGAGLEVDASSRSGSVTLDGDSVEGTVTKRRVSGTVRGGGPLIRVVSGSGSIRLLLNARR